MGVKLRLEGDLLDGRVVVETPWADELGDDLYRLDNSPWWRGDLSWRDVVRAEPLAPDDFPTVVALVEPGGHQTFRVLFDARVTGERQHAVLEALNAAGATYEGTGAEREGVYAIDVAPEESADAAEAVLREAAGEGLLRYELGGSIEFLTELDQATRTENFTARHPAPLVAADDAELVLVEVPGHPTFPRTRYEQLWARPRGHDTYELLSAPFVAYELYVGDAVRVEREAGHIPRVADVVERSGRWVLRALVDEDGPDPAVVEQQLLERAARVERSPRWPRYLAVDAASEAEVRALRAWLDGQEADGALVYETGWP